MEEEIVERLLDRLERLAVDKGELKKQCLSLSEEMTELKNKHKAEVSILRATIQAFESGGDSCMVTTTTKKEV